MQSSLLMRNHGFSIRTPDWWLCYVTIAFHMLAWLTANQLTSLSRYSLTVLDDLHVRQRVVLCGPGKMLDR